MSLKSFFHKALTEAGSVLSIIPAVGPLIGGAVEEVGSMIDPAGNPSGDYNKAVQQADNMVTAAGLVANDQTRRAVQSGAIKPPSFFSTLPKSVLYIGGAAIAAVVAYLLLKKKKRK
jgi:hypothetical protein